MKPIVKSTAIRSTAAFFFVYLFYFLEQRLYLGLISGVITGLAFYGLTILFYEKFNRDEIVAKRIVSGILSGITGKQFKKRENAIFATHRMNCFYWI